MPFGMHWVWLIGFLVLVLIIFGPGKLPELGNALGKGIREFRKATTDLTEEVRNATSEPEAKKEEPAATTEAKTENKS